MAPSSERPVGSVTAASAAAFGTAVELAAVLDHIPAVVALIDRDRINRFANWAHAYWFGRAPHEMAGQHSRDLLGEELYEESRPYYDAVLAGVPQSYERAFLTPAGERRHTLVQLQPYVLDGTVQGIAVLIVDVTGRVRADHTRRELADRLEAMGAQERSASGVEEAATRRLEVVADRLARLPQTDAGPAAAAAAIAASARELRALITGRRPTSGPEEEIRDAVDRTADWLGFPPSVVVLGALDRLDHETAEDIGDVLSETLLNVSRHSGARRVAVTVAIEGDDAVVVVADDGTGLVRPRPGSGLDGLRRTAHERGGRLTWVINDDDGTTVEWRAPLRTSARATPGGAWAQVKSANPASARGVRLPPADYRTPDTVGLDARELRVLLDLLPMAMTTWDAQLRNTFANRAAAQWTGRPDATAMLGRSIAEIVRPAVLERVVPLTQAALAGSHFVQEGPYYGPPGSPAHVRIEYIPHIVDGTVRGVHLQVTDIGEQVQAQSAAHDEADRVRAIAARHRADELAHHDAIQDLFATSLRLEQALAGLPAGTQGVVEQALDDVHAAIADLRASVVDTGAPDADPPRRPGADRSAPG